MQRMDLWAVHYESTGGMDGRIPYGAVIVSTGLSHTTLLAASGLRQGGGRRRLTKRTQGNTHEEGAHCRIQQRWDEREPGFRVVQACEAG